MIKTDRSREGYGNPINIKRSGRIKPALLCLGVIIIIAGCNGENRHPTAVDSSVSLFLGSPITPTPFQPLPPTSPALIPTSTHTDALSAFSPTHTAEFPGLAITDPSDAPTLWIAPSLPTSFQEALKLPDGIVTTTEPGKANLRLEVISSDNTSSTHLVSRWVYALVSPFPTIEDGVSLKTLLRCWQGELAGPFAGRPLLMDQSTYSVLSARWGEPASGAVKVLEPGKLLNAAWKDRPSWGIVPFEALEPRWKVLEVDRQSPVRKDFKAETYPLSIPIVLSGWHDSLNALLPGIPPTNRNPEKLTTVVMTGVTAMVRATAYVMERDGIKTPAEYVGEWLREADITHISNEVPFSPNCPFPNPKQEGLRFCSSPRYIELLEEIGTDVVELTGDHFADWGAEATLFTLQMYRERGWPYYGGGENIQDGRKPATFEHHGNRIAFIGCNAKGGGYATADENSPGAVACDDDWMHAEIARLKKKGFLVIATFQHIEVYAYTVPDNMRQDFVDMAKAGAVIVSGSQAHQPHGMEFVGGSFLHFGLGNLFFDQYRFFPGPETDRAFIDRHVFYDGRYISVELLPIYFVNLSHGRPMTTEEKTAFLEEIFRASGW